MQHLVAIVCTALAAVFLAGSVSVTYGLAAAYGAGTPYEGGLGWALLVLAPGGLALLCLIAARDAVGRRRPRTSVLAVGVLVVFTAAGAGAAAYGGSVHERDRAAEAAAGAADDLALLAEVTAAGASTPPAGEADGGCSVVVSSVPDAALAEARVVAALEQAGWRRVRAGDGREFERGRALLRLSVTTDGKATDVRLTVL